MKNYLKTKIVLTNIILISIFTSFLSCNKDQNVEITPIKSNYNAKLINFKDLIKEDKDLKKIIFQLKDNKTVNNDFFENSKPLVLTTDKYTSYTFILEEESLNENLLKNFVLVSYNDGSYQQLITEYPTYFNNGNLEFDYNNSKAKFIYSSSVNERTTCNEDEVPIANWDPDINCIAVLCGLEGDHMPWQVCRDGTQRAYWECRGGYVEGCTSAPGPIGDGGNNNSSNNPTQGSGTLGDNQNEVNSGNDGILLIPREPNHIQSIRECLGYGELLEEGENQINLNTLSDELLYRISQFLLKENTRSPESIYFINSLLNLTSNDTNIDENAFNFVLEAFNQNKIYNNFDSSFLNSVNQYTNVNFTAFDPGLIQLQLYFSTTCAVLRDRFSQEPGWNDLSPLQQDIKIYWEASKDLVHLSLDIFGMIPVVGEVADLTNGVLYLIEGDGVNATLSFAATLPVVGWGATTGKYVFKLTATSLGTKVRLTWKVLENGKVYFGSSGSKLRKVLGLTNPDYQAHHIMPWLERIWNHNVIQKASKSGNTFHMNEALNGIAVQSWRNQPNHPTYTNLVKAKLDEFNNLNPNASVDEAYDFVSGLISDIRDWVINNPNSHLNELVLP